MQISALITTILIILCTGHSYAQVPTNLKNTDRILFITSNQHTYGSTKRNTANHFAEIVLAYDVLSRAGYQIDIMSPEGGAIPIGYIQTSDSIQKKYLYDAGFMNILKYTLRPADINPTNYKAVYYSGGGAAMFGVPENKEIQKIVMQIYNQQGLITAVCHGTAGLVQLKNNEGAYVYEGKKVCGFPDRFENMEAAYYKTFPFSIEQRIKKNKGIFEYSKEGWDGFYTIDGRLITGQDPTASAIVAQKIVEQLQKTN